MQASLSPGAAICKFLDKRTIACLLTISTSQELYDSAGHMTPKYVADIRTILVDFLAATGIKLDASPFNNVDLLQSSSESAIAEGFDEDFVRSPGFQRYLRLGTFAKLAYGVSSCSSLLFQNLH